jgi:hypothetical protein
MTTEPQPTADRRVVLAVVIALAVIAVVGLVGLLVLIERDVPPESLLAITGIVGPASGALAALLASTRTAAPAIEAARAEGYNEAVAKVQELDT